MGIKLSIKGLPPKGVKFHTYDDWKKLDYYVRRGEKSEYINKFGDPVFTEDQVEEKSNGYFINDDRSVFDIDTYGDL